VNRATITFAFIPKEKLTDYCREVKNEKLQNFTLTVIILKGTLNIIEYIEHPYKLWRENYKERRQFDDLGVEGRVIL